MRGKLETPYIVSYILTYIRREWEHTANAVAPATVKKLRAKVTKRNEAWSEGELLKIPSLVSSQWSVVSIATFGTSGC
jgi:hypothetical protein